MGYNAMQVAWLQRVASYVDVKLGQAKLSYFTLDREIGVYMGKAIRDLPSEQWTPPIAHGSLLSLRKDYGRWKRLCADDGHGKMVPVWRGSLPDSATADCVDQTINGDSYKAQR